MKKLIALFLSIGIFISPLIVNGAGPFLTVQGGTATTTAIANYLLIGNTAGTAWTEIATSSLGISGGGGSGTVTSVAATVPTGLSISGSPITTSGTLAFGLQSGYNIPLTASTTNWENFYEASSTLPYYPTFGYASSTFVSFPYATSTFLTIANGVLTYVPYTGATGAVNLNGQNLTNVNNFAFTNASGTALSLSGNFFVLATSTLSTTTLSNIVQTGGAFLAVNAKGQIVATTTPSFTTGTVTAVTVTTANGVSATVANQGTTPALTFTLGAITPTSVNTLKVWNSGGGTVTDTGVGVNALVNTTNTDVTGFGYGTLTGSSGADNTGVGYLTLNIDTGIDNTAIGSQSMVFNTSGTNNTALGVDSLVNMVSGSNSIALGFQAGTYATSTSNELFINNQDRTNYLGDQRKSLIYGQFNSATSSQLLVINASTTISSLQSAGFVKSTASGALYTDGTSYQPSGTYVTAVSVATANGFAGSSSGGATPALTLTTTATGVLVGNGTSIAATTTTGAGSVVLQTSPTLTTPILGVASGTALSLSGNLWVTGQTTVGNASGTSATLTGNLNENANIVLSKPNSLLSSGWVYTFGTSASTTAGDIVFLDSANQWADANAVSSTTASSTNELGLALNTATGGNTLSVLRQGLFFNPSWNFATGTQILLGTTTPGQITNNAPFAQGNCMRVVGFMISSSTLDFSPSPDYACN